MSTFAFLIPSFNPGYRLLLVVRRLDSLLKDAGLRSPIFVVDDGSTDESTSELSELGVLVKRHQKNRGKGAALRTGLEWAQAQGITQLITLDADGQHPPEEALKLAQCSAGPDALVLAVRDLKAAGAPRPNQWSNRFSNRVLSLFAGTTLLDTQCGLRRYPVSATLGLGAPDDGYAFESDVVLRAARRGLPIVHIDSRVLYPPPDERLSYFHSVKDPAKMVYRVVKTALTIR